MTAGEELRAMLDGVAARDGVSLSPVERLLLTTDGTVTNALEALTRGEVTVDILNRDVKGSTLHREVALRRDVDGSALAWAESRTNLYPLDTDIEDSLVNGQIGIGDLLREKYAETRREVEEMDAVWHDTQDFPDFITGTSAMYLRRTYKIHSGGDRIMTITEYFPKGLY